jgi:hypothetical protein
MTALAPLVPKIAKLIPRLATNHDGEVVATVRAIERTLASAGLDLHDLAGALEREPETRTVIVYRERAPNSYSCRPPPQWRPSCEEPESLREQARWCCEQDSELLNAHERNFVKDMFDLLTFGGSPTVKQAAWLRHIHCKLRKGTGS